MSHPSSPSFSPSLTTHRARKRTPLYILPAFADALGGVDAAAYAELEELLCRAFLALRTHTSLLVWTLTQTFAHLGLRTETRDIALLTLKESLFLEMDNLAASKAFKEVIAAGLRNDYQMRVKQ